MENQTTTGSKDATSTKKFLFNFLSNLLLKYLKWDELLKDSEKLFGDADLGSNGDGTPVDRNKTLAVLDWRTSNGALTQDEKIRLHRDLKIIMKSISGVDTMLTEFMVSKQK